ncbi:isochorismatase family protein [Candidatus Gottesmanbacteria bacterium]|nr:isochorismatase family protein [Candidatus Gottesmanbacteria bacterium]
MNTNISKFIKISTRNTALLVIDMQLDFYAPDGKAAKRGKLVREMQSISGRVHDFVHTLANSGVLVVLTKFIAGQGITPENLRIAVEKEGYDFPCIKGSGGEEFYGITPPKNATIIENHTTTHSRIPT